jgi:hypothetical protein
MPAATTRIGLQTPPPGRLPRTPRARSFQIDVEQNHIHIVIEQGERFRRGFALTHYFEVRLLFEGSRQSLAEHGVIVHQQKIYGF